MYNMDEKGFMMGIAQRCKVVCRRRRRIPRFTQDRSRDWVTIVEAISADGFALRPLVINKGVAHYMGWYAGLKKEDLASFGYSAKGWINEHLGLKWLQETFDKETKKR